MKVWSIIAKWLFILCVPVLLLTASIAVAINSQWFYEYSFHKYNVSQTTGLSNLELGKAAHGLISYFNSSEEYINLTVVKDGNPFILFNEREVAHLKDVKALFWLDYKVLLGTLIYVLAYAGVMLWQRKWRKLAGGVVWGSGITLGLMLAFGFGALLSPDMFSRFFWQFHLLSFANDLWQLDPSTDYLIMLVPPGFWYDIARFIGGVTAGLAVVLGGVGTMYLKKIKTAS